MELQLVPCETPTIKNTKLCHFAQFDFNSKFLVISENTRIGKAKTSKIWYN